MKAVVKLHTWHEPVAVLALYRPAVHVKYSAVTPQFILKETELQSNFLKGHFFCLSRRIHSGDHDPEKTTSIYSCHGVFPFCGKNCRKMYLKLNRPRKRQVIGLV